MLFKIPSYFTVTFVMAIIISGKSFASEICEWTADTTMELHELRVDNNFSESNLKRFAKGFVELERDENFFKKSIYVGVLEGFVEIFFDPEMYFLMDGTLSQDEVRNVFFEACSEVIE